MLAQLCGAVIAKLELLAAERANIEQVASPNADLASTVSTLTKIMETHRQLNEIVANAGKAGIAKTLHQLTRFPVLIQDVHGNTRAAAGDVPSHRRAKEQPEKRQELIRQLQITRQALYHRGTWLVLANPRPGVLGVIALIDPARTANQTDLAALEYAATVLSVELSRLEASPKRNCAASAISPKSCSRARTTRRSRHPRMLWGTTPNGPTASSSPPGGRTTASTSNSSRPSSVRCAASTWPR